MHLTPPKNGFTLTGTSEPGRATIGNLDLISQSIGLIAKDEPILATVDNATRFEMGIGPFAPDVEA